MIFYPNDQGASTYLTYMIRTAGEPAAFVPQKYRWRLRRDLQASSGESSATADPSAAELRARRLVLAGTGWGVIAGLGLTRLLSSLLFGVKPWDLAAFAAVAVLLMMVALLASWIPARLAMRVDPMFALRHE